MRWMEKTIWMRRIGEPLLLNAQSSMKKFEKWNKKWTPNMKETKPLTMNREDDKEDMMVSKWEKDTRVSTIDFCLLAILVLFRSVHLIRLKTRDDSLLFFRFERRCGDWNGAKREHGAGGMRRCGALARHQRLTIVQMAFVAEELESRSRGRQKASATMFSRVQNRRR